MAAEGENLDARMEAIRLKNEELEKKHKEILEDEISARAQNAIVDVKNQNCDNQPHPYDHVELDFDVRPTDKELAKNPDYKPKSESLLVLFTFYEFFHVFFSHVFFLRLQIEDLLRGKIC